MPTLISFIQYALYPALENYAYSGKFSYGFSEAWGSLPQPLDIPNAE
jgi:hypothetical protein